MCTKETNFLSFLYLLTVLSISFCIHPLFLDDVETLVLKYQVLHLEYTQDIYVISSYFSINEK